MLDEIISRDSSLFLRFLIGRARHSLFMARQKELAPCDISPPQANVVFILYCIGHKATLAELSRYTDRGVSALSVQLARMEKDGLVKKSRENRRSTLLKFELTEKGLKAYSETKEMKAYDEVMSVLTMEERQQLISSLQKIINKSDKYRTMES
jgi:DNA-binding MarR family transcriptional regulator